MKRGGPLTRKTRLRQTSAKTAAQRPARRACVDAVVARDRECIPKRVGAPGACVGPLTAHELIKRSAGGSPLDPENCVASCWGHNGWIEDNPDRARELGLVLRKEPS